MTKTSPSSSRPFFDYSEKFKLNWSRKCIVAYKEREFMFKLAMLVIKNFWIRRLVGSSKFLVICALFLGLFAEKSAFAYEDRPGDFNYWALTMSWSPTFCESEAGRNARQQCGPGRRIAFVIHGLWPQYQRGWPENCAGVDGYVPRSIIEAMIDVMPSKGLIIHEWRKHGTCSGLGQHEYFALARRLFEKISIPARYIEPTAYLLTSPEKMREDFLTANRWLRQDGMVIRCGNRRDRANLSEIRICFDRNLKPSACGMNERRQCQARQLILPPVR